MPPSSSQPGRDTRGRADELPRPIKRPPAERGATGTRRPASPATPPPQNRTPRAAPIAAPPPSRRRDRPGLRTGKVLLSVVSVLVFGVTAYAYNNFGQFFEGFTTANVLDAGAGGEKPADGSVDILLVGMDSRVDAQGKPLSSRTLSYLRAGVSDGELNTDTIILLHIPNDGSKAVAFSIPRDSYVDIPGGYGQHKINSAYLRAKNDWLKTVGYGEHKSKSELEVESNQEGAKELVRTVQDLTGVTIDHFASINLLGFYEITKAIGGVDVCLKDDVSDSYSGADFKAGRQTISGRAALAFVRQRHGLPNGDLDRIGRQQAFLAGMANKILSAGTLTSPDKLDNLLAAVRKSVVLDQSWNIASFAQQAQGLTGGKIKFQTIPVGSLSLSTDDGDAVEVDPSAVASAVRGAIGQADDSTEMRRRLSRIAVAVHNSSTVPGLAGTVQSALVHRGFTPGVTGNAESASETSVRYAAGERENGVLVAKALGDHPTLIEDAGVPAGNVGVYLGSGYDGLASDTATQAGSSEAAPKPPSKPITADGITCVN